MSVCSKLTIKMISDDVSCCFLAFLSVMFFMFFQLYCFWQAILSREYIATVKYLFQVLNKNARLAADCSANMFKFNSKDTRTTLIDFVVVSLFEHIDVSLAWLSLFWTGHSYQVIFILYKPVLVMKTDTSVNLDKFKEWNNICSG